MSFLSELKRRNVVKVAVAFAVVAWLLIQVIDIVLPRFGAPEWAVTSLMFVIILGFPVALVLAWAFEFTPDGIKSQQVVDATGYEKSGSKLNTVIFSVMALAIVFLGIDNYVLEDSSLAPEQIASESPPSTDLDNTETADLEKSIAVLPFANQSNDPDQDYFAEGLSEELLNRLARIQDLLVAGRTSSFYFKGSNASMSEIGRELGVAHILEGSIRKSGNDIRISAQLIRADNGFQLWSDTYDRSLEDIFAIQDEIAEAVITALSVTLSAGEFNRPGMTSNVQAYEAFLRADTALNPIPEITLENIGHLENAVAIDPNFGIAWNALYRVYEFATITLPPNMATEYMALTDPARERALALMPDAPEVLVSSAISQRRMKNFAVAEDLFLDAITQFGNSDAEANLNYGELLWSVGRVNDALPYLQRARRLDPKQAAISVRLGTSLLALEQFEEARAEVLRGMAANPDDGLMASTMGLVNVAEGDTQKIRETVEATSSFQAFGSFGQISSSAILKYLDGDQAAAIQDLSDFAENNTFSPMIATVIGPTAAMVGDNELALSIHVDATRSSSIDMFGSFSIWQNYLSGMRQLEGFKEMAAESGLVDYWRTTGEWGDFCRPLEGSDDFECF